MKYFSTILLTLATPTMPLWAPPAPRHVTIDIRPGLVHELRLEIQRYEGGNTPGTFPYRINDPCAITFAGQFGAVRHVSGYAQFATREAGEMACESDLRAKFARGWDVRKVLSFWAGGSYAEDVARDLGINLELRWNDGR